MDERITVLIAAGAGVGGIIQGRVPVFKGRLDGTYL